MDVKNFPNGAGTGCIRFRADRVEIPVDGCVGTHDTTVIILDADDSFDIIIEDETGERECIYSFVKEVE